MPDPKYLLARQMLCQFLREEAAAKGITNQQIADATGFSQPNVSRMLNAHYAPSLDNFLKIADAIGVNFYMESKDSPSDSNQAFEQAMAELGRRQAKGNKLN